MCFVAPAVTTTVPGNMVIDSVTRDECVNNGYEDPNSAGNMQVRGAVSRTVSLVLQLCRNGDHSPVADPGFTRREGANSNGDLLFGYTCPKTA